MASVLGIDYGTSNTVAALRWPDGRCRPLLFDGAPSLPSAVFRQPNGALLTGRDAIHSARLDPAGFEPNPKRRIDDGTLLLGASAVPLVEVVAATLRRVAAEALRAGATPPDGIAMTYPAAWGAVRRGVLVDAAARAGLPAPTLVPEPVAAAAYYTTVLGHAVRPGHLLVVYDLGAGTFDVSVVRRTADGFEVCDVDGLGDFGGTDLDGLVVGVAGAAVASGSPDGWRRLTAPESAADRRHFRSLWDDARTAKEMLSREQTAGLHVPLLDREVHVTRAEFEAAAEPHLAEAATLTAAVMRRAGVTPANLAGLFLVGGASRVPLAATTLHRATGVAPTVLEQPELVVAEGALHAVARRPPTGPAPLSPPPTSPPTAPFSSPPATPFSAPTSPATPLSPPPAAPFSAPTSPAAPLSPPPAAPYSPGPIAASPPGYPAPFSPGAIAASPPGYPAPFSPPPAPVPAALAPPGPAPVRPGVALLAVALMLAAVAGAATVETPAEAFTLGVLGGVPGALLLRAALTRPPGSGRQRRWLGWMAVPLLMLAVPALSIGAGITKYVADGGLNALSGAVVFDVVGTILLVAGLWLLRLYRRPVS